MSCMYMAPRESNDRQVLHYSRPLELCCLRTRALETTFHPQDDFLGNFHSFAF